MPREVSLRVSSFRECSRRVSSPNARCVALNSALRRCGLRSVLSGEPSKRDYLQLNSVFSLVVRAFIAARFGGLKLLSQCSFQLHSEGRVVLEELAGVFLALADALAVVAIPGAGFLDQLG